MRHLSYGLLIIMAWLLPMSSFAQQQTKAPYRTLLAHGGHFKHSHFKSVHRILPADLLLSALPNYTVNESINKIPCPKLLPLSSNSNAIIYHDRMLSDRCDYYVYLKAGQIFYLSTSHRSIQASTISPYEHDFNDGPMHVRQTGRHVIRLKRHYHFGNNDESIGYALKLEIIQPQTQQEQMIF